MRRLLMSGWTAAVLLLCSVGIASAHHLNGVITCAGNASPLSGVVVDVTGPGGPYSGVTDATGYYQVDFAGAGCYHATLELNAGETSSPPSFDFCLTDDAPRATENWTISGGRCNGSTPGACWLTGGGTKFSTITDTDLGESAVGKGKKLFNWGGNVNPGCSPTAGDGGSWNLIDVAQSLHFHATHIEVVTCDNVPGIPDGSTSPATPFNYIEFKGWGTLKGIKGNKADYGTVFFYARAEDRNEPGSNGQRDGDGKDRLFVNVFTVDGNPASSVILVSQGTNPTVVDPLIITTGNLQIHISSCDVLPAGAQQARQMYGITEGGSPTAPAAPNGTWGRLKVMYR